MRIGVRRGVHIGVRTYVFHRGQERVCFVFALIYVEFSKYVFICKIFFFFYPAPGYLITIIDLPDEDPPSRTKESEK